MKNKLPSYSIEVDENPVLNEMLGSIEKFYPVGNEIPNDQFKGYQKLFDKISSKINQLIKGELPAPFDQLVDTSEKEFSAYKIVKETERQFPNYAMSIELSKKDLDDLIVIKNLRVRISLIANFFTMFHEETIIHKGVSLYHSLHVPVITTLVSSHSQIVDKDGKLFSKLKGLVESTFPEHKFVNHYLLFNAKLKDAVPHGFDVEQYGTEFPLYNFLFDYDFISPSFNTVVL